MPDDVTELATTAPARHRLLTARLRSQRLAGAPARDPLEATRSLLAIQAQDPRGARLAVRARTRGGHASDVDRALTVDRSLVITWVNRGTLHLVASEDEPLLHALTTPQLRAASDRRLAQEGVNPAAAERGIAAIARALGDRGPMTRTQIRTVLERVQVPHAGQALAHVLFRATVDGLLVRGPLVGDEHAFVLSADWLGERPQLDRERALAELARRYLVGHGPADDRDLAKWANVPLRDARAGLKAIAPELHERPDGLLELRGHPVGRLPPPRLLGPFDPVLLGWCSRTFVLDHPPEVVTTNGIIRSIALVDGRAAGTWKMPGGRVELNLWNEPDEPTAAALRDEAVAVETYLGDRPPRPGGKRRQGRRP
jgi:Winged helix DNA-binding domain